MSAAGACARATLAAAALAAGPAAGAPDTAAAERGHIVLASTTSTENSGLLAAILPRFERRTGIAVRVVAVGTGQAIRLAERGDADVLLVHHRPSEEDFVARGYGLERREVMHNDFVVVGPRADPAGVAGMDDVARALARVAARRAIFVSRGDDSGTHKREMALWRAAKVDPRGASGRWYRETGSGMGATLNIAATLDAYALSDRATWLRFANKQALAVLVAGDRRLFNPYGAIVVDPARHPHVPGRLANRFVDWLTSSEGRAAIAAFRIDGRQAFFPAARRDGRD